MKIGNSKIIFSETLQIPDGVEAEVNIKLGDNELLPVILSFNPEGAEQGVSWQSRDGYLYMTFTKWNNSLGTSLTEPGNIGTYRDKEILVWVYQQRISSINNVHFQVTLGGVTDDQ